MTEEEMREEAFNKSPYTPPADSLDVLKGRLKILVNERAEVERLKYLTAGSGQAMTYREKAIEADRYVETSGQGSYPFLSSLVEAGSSPDLASAANLIIQSRAAWAAVGSAIELKRERAKIQISAASNEAEAIAASQVSW